MNNKEIQQLKALAEAATPGPWERDTIRSEGEYGSDDDGGYGYDSYEVTDSKGRCIMDCLNNDDGSVHVGHDGHAWDEVAKHDAAYVSAASPDVILALIAKVEALEADAERFSLAIAKEDNADSLLAAVINNAPDGGAIREEFDAAMEKEKA